MNQTAEVLEVLCECRSGLRKEICCGAEKVRRLTDEDMQSCAANLQQAEAALARGDQAEAEQLCVNLLERTPGHAQALHLLYRIKLAAGINEAAEALLQRAVRIEPNNAQYACDLSMLLYQKRDLPGAELHARNAIRLAPHNAQAHNMLGMIFTEANQPLPGEYHYRMALKLHKPVGKLLANMGLNLRNQGKLEESEQFYREALRLEPDNIASLLGWVKLEETARHFDRAWELLDQAERLKPGGRELALMRATLLGREKKYAEAIQVLDEIAAGAAQPEQLGSGYYIERGAICDKMGCYDDAFAAYDHANQLTRASGRGSYDRASASNLVDRVRNFYTRSRLKILPRAALRTDAPQPIFIIGFPRSGTTMTEQILTAHPDICAGDELTFINDLVRFAPKMLNSPLAYPECLADLWMGDNQEALDTFRDFYIKRTQQLGILKDGARFFTDKMPLNEMQLGLISLVFPQSPIIHLLRHPLDVVLSSYFTDMTHGFKMSYDLQTVAEHYVLIADLIQHYLGALDIRYKAVRYEDIVQDQEHHTRDLLDFVGVPWDERCLDFHENRRYARTASYAQVTEKLYTRSRYRYKNYRKHLEPVIAILAPVIERLGYSIE